MDFQSKIVKWSKDRNLLQNTTELHQFTKLMEECGELGRAILNKNIVGIIDSIGDIQVVLAQICEKYNLKLVDCQNYSYNEIKNRKGKIINGTFIKD